MVADISNRESLIAACEWKSQVDQCVHLKSGQPLPMILALNKYDLVSDVGEEKLEEFMTQAAIDKFVEDNDFVLGTRISAKTGEGVNLMFSKLVREVLLREFRFDSDAPDRSTDIKKSIIDYN